MNNGFVGDTIAPSYFAKFGLGSPLYLTDSNILIDANDTNN